MELGADFKPASQYYQISGARGLTARSTSHCLSVLDRMMWYQTAASIKGLSNAFPHNNPFNEDIILHGDYPSH